MTPSDPPRLDLFGAADPAAARRPPRPPPPDAPPDGAPPARPAAGRAEEGPEALTPSALLHEVQRRLIAAFRGPVVVEGRVVGVRDARGWVTVTLADPHAEGRFPTRLDVSIPPRVSRFTVPEALVEQALVQVTGTVRVWVQRAEVQLQAIQVARVGHSQTQASYDAAVAAIDAERLGRVRPRLPLFLRRVLVLAPHGTTLGDLTRDLGGWQPPHLLHRGIPGDSPDLHQLVASACDEVPDVDLVVLARGGTIETISGWDDLELLRCVDRLQRGGLPFLLAVGHAQHTPLVYRVAGNAVRHTAEAGRWLADHNRSAAARIEALAAVPGLLTGLVQRQEQAVERAAAQAASALRTRLATVERQLQRDGRTVHRSLIDQVERGQAQLERDGRVLVRALRAHVAERARRLELATATLDGFRVGLALISAPDGGRARLAPGERVVIETADATALATVDEVTRHLDADPALDPSPATADPSPAPDPTDPEPRP